MKRLTSNVLAAIRERFQKATPGPWKWTEDEWNEAKYFQPLGRGDGPRSKRRPRKGRRLRDSWLLFLQGPFTSGPRSETEKLSVKEIVDLHLADEYEFRGILRLRWNDIKGDHFIGGPLPEDQDFIAAARSDVPLLMDALESAYAEIDRLQQQQAVTGGGSFQGAAPGD